MSDSESNWWDSLEVYEDDYVPEDYTPDSSVRANHALLEGLRDNDFDIDEQSYTLGLLTLALVFFFAGMLACICLPMLYCCLNKSRSQRYNERMRQGRKTPEEIEDQEIKGGLLMVVVSLMAVACAMGAIYGLARSDTGLSQMEDTTQEMADDFREILDLPNDTSVLLDNTTAAFYDLVDESETCSNPLVSALISSVSDSFVSSMETVQEELQDAITEDVDDLADDVEDIADVIGTTEGVRKGVVWPAVALSVWAIVAFVIIGMTTYGVVARGVSPCGKLTCCLLPGTLFLAAIIWISAACAVTLSALSGDFCIDAEDNVQDIIKSSVDGSLVEDLLTYYTTDCSSDNSVVDAVLSAQEDLLSVIETVMPTLSELPDYCSNLTEPVSAISDNLEASWDLLYEAAELSSCSNINGLYQEIVYDKMCSVLPAGLLAFWVSCVFVTVLLFILVFQWVRMLQRRVTEGDVSQHEQEPAKPANLWVSTQSIMRAASTYGRSTRDNSFGGGGGAGAGVGGGAAGHGEPARQPPLAPAFSIASSSVTVSQGRNDPAPVSRRYEVSGHYVTRPSRGSAGGRSYDSGDPSTRAPHEGSASWGSGGGWEGVEMAQGPLERSSTGRSSDFTGVVLPEGRPMEVNHPQRW